MTSTFCLRLGLFGVVAAVGMATPVSAQLVRQANTTLVMPLNPPTTAFATQDAFGAVSTFSSPIALAAPPGENNRVFVVERAGRIQIISNLSTTPAKALFFDIAARVTQDGECGLLGLAFHPQFATNGFFFVTYSTSNGNATYQQKLARFTASGNAVDVGTEVVLINQFDQASNHNGGDIHFGPDGYLYYSIGDEGGGNDSFGNSQRIDLDFFSGIIRIDVDRLASNLEPNPHVSVVVNASTQLANYKIPVDNPFVGATTFNGSPVTSGNVRTEWWAVGLRNPFRFSFDPANAKIYCGDVGQNVLEEVDVVVKGGNYGWSYREGNIAGPRSNPPAAAQFVEPILVYPHTSGNNAITGGVVYRGANLSQLYGNYIYGDSGGGHIYALAINEVTGLATTNTLIANEGAPVAFGTDPRSGDVLICNIGSGKVRRLVTSGAPSGTLPATLSATGAFADLLNLIPNAGIVPYTPNVPFWSDYATKRRWFSIPDVTKKLIFSQAGNWTLPTGTVWIKHFEIETTRGVPATSRRLETRILVKNDNGIYGVTYRWNAGGTDANLVADAGGSETFTVIENGTPRSQTWNYPSRSACLSCHTYVGGYALGFNTAQLNGNNVYNGQTQNQIAALSSAGYFTQAVGGTNTMTKLAPSTDVTQSLEWRVRSYLSVNCSQCHQPGGPGLGNWDARHATKTVNAGIVNGFLNDNRGNVSNRVVVPGDLGHSVMYQRLNDNPGAGSIFMPPVATNERDLNSIQLLSDWIQTVLPSFQTFAQWQQANFGSTSAPAAQPTANPDGDFNDNRTEFLVGTNPNSAAEAWTYFVTTSGGNVTLNFPRVANRRFQVQVSTDLQNWSLWDVPANAPAYSATSFVDTMTARASGAPQFFRFEIDSP